MLNIVFELERNNLNPVLDSFGMDSRNYVISGESSEMLIARILQEMSGRNNPAKTKIMFTASRCGETRFFNVPDVCYLESFRNLVEISDGKEGFEFYGVLQKIDKRIGKFGFCRINRSYLVSLSHIRMIRHGFVILDNGKEIRIGREYRSHFQNAMKQRDSVLLNTR